ncbi:Conserved hypothetical protein [gamma proteobacterium HdN1]|nr:Conserved hypothetical protein [gamma proteobacterium HdN1]
MKIRNAARTATASMLMLISTQALSLELGAGFEGSATISAASNYAWRGISQTSNRPAIQGGLDLTHASGFYVGTWFSNVDFPLAPQAHTEQDVYAGYGFQVGKLAFDLKFTQYLYDNASALNFGESHAQASYTAGKLGTFAAGLDYSNDTPINDSDSTIHYYGTYSQTLPQELALSATVGSYDFKDDGWVGGKDSKYAYYSIGVSKELYGVNVGLTYTDTNIGESSCEAFAGDKSYCNSILVSAAKTFK